MILLRFVLVPTGTRALQELALKKIKSKILSYETGIAQVIKIYAQTQDDI